MKQYQVMFQGKKTSSLIFVNQDNKVVVIQLNPFNAATRRIIPYPNKFNQSNYTYCQQINDYTELKHSWELVSK